MEDRLNLFRSIVLSVQCLKCMVLYVLLAPHTNEQWDLLHRINLLRELELVPEYKALLGLFINQEIIGWKETVLSRYEPILRHGAAGSPEANVMLSIHNSMR